MTTDKTRPWGCEATSRDRRGGGVSDEPLSHATVILRPQLVLQIIAPITFMLKKMDNLTIRNNSLVLQAYTFWLPTYVDYIID